MYFIEAACVYKKSSMKRVQRQQSQQNTYSYSRFHLPFLFHFDFHILFPFTFILLSETWIRFLQFDTWSAGWYSHLLETLLTLTVIMMIIVCSHIHMFYNISNLSFCKRDKARTGQYLLILEVNITSPLSCKLKGKVYTM